MKSAAKAMRKEPTVAEDALWAILRSFRAKGFRFRRQAPKGRFVLDFYCAAVHLAIEAYGGIHDVESVVRRDKERIEILEDAYRLEVLCIANNLILTEPDAVRKLIAARLKARSSELAKQPAS